jgi:hypothetical protein
MARREVEKKEGRKWDGSGSCAFRTDEDKGVNMNIGD